LDDAALKTLSPLAADVRDQSPDRYLSTLFAPPQYRKALLALYAFDGELARIQQIVNEPMAGLIRLQWWDDVIDGLGGGEGIAHPIIQALDQAVAENGLERTFLKDAIEGRRRLFESDEPPGPSDYEDYLSAIGGNVACAAAALLGVDDDAGLDMAREAGFASAAWDQYRLYVGSRPERRAWLPAVWLEDDGHERIRHSLRERAFARLANVRKRAIKIDRSVLSAYFPATLAGIRFKRAETISGQHVVPAAPARLFWYWLRGRF
jgi:phytoene synthase